MTETEIKDARAAFAFLLSEMGFGGDFNISPIAGSGSDRCYFRIVVEGRTFIGTFVPDAVEGKCFVKMARDLKSAAASVPEVFAVSADYHYYIQEDLGTISLFSVLSSPERDELVRETMRRLVQMQKIPMDIWHDDCVSKDFGRRQVMWDLNYFKYEFLKIRNVIFDEDLLENDFVRLADRIMEIPSYFNGFMMRDCQSRNVMITDDGPVFIDFQGGRLGPVLYDAVSFLWQARAGFSDSFRMEMLGYYCDAFCNGESVKTQEMLTYLDDMVLFRTIQVLGAYGYRGLVQRKAHFLLSIPSALANLKGLLEKGVLNRYQELENACKKIVDDSSGDFYITSGRLRVDVFSFSYKVGYPDDLSGNGGGFMFDCRAMHNPGRYAAYRNLTGRDKEVAEFLETRGEVKAFLNNVQSLTDPAIERYLSRGFSHLQIGFGCTGGQHRSVYCAEKTADHIRKTFPEVDLHLTHVQHPIKS
ncbi:MAG: phosphotransferase [Muribaculaceae bacterium]|nr:phosphotransferase [Muribaculaceae bacterium]